MRFAAASALKDLRRLRRDPWSLALRIGIPLFLAVILNLVFGREGAKPHGHLFVADLDSRRGSRCG
jgi:hypothetical protein